MWQRLNLFGRRWACRLWLFLNPVARGKNASALKFQEFISINNQEAFEIMYSSPDMLQHYLVNSRLDFYRQVAKKIAQNQVNRSDAACVDVGCGTGHLLNELRKIGYGGRLVGLDYAATAREQVYAHNANIEFYPGFIGDQPWREEFDLVLCTEVLEHCEYPADIIRQMIQVAKPQGRIVITVPDGRKDTWKGHIHFWSPEGFKLFIESFGKKAIFDYFEDVNYCEIYC